MEIEEKCKFKINDIVEVVLPEKHYPTHERLFKLLGFKNTKSNSYLNDKIMSTQWKVFNTAYGDNRYCIALRNKNNEELLISEGGIRLIERNNKTYSLWN